MSSRKYKANQESYDQFRIKKIHPTKNNGDEWFMDMHDFKDDNRIKLSYDSLRKERGGKYWSGTPDKGMDPNSFRVNVLTKSRNTNATPDHKKATRQGYMAGPGDWRNVEITGYFRIIDPENRSEEITMYSRGGSHSTDNGGCTGTAYKPGIEYNGSPAFKKEYWHSNGYWAGTDSEPEYVHSYGDWSPDQDLLDSISPAKRLGSIVGKWMGQKAVVYDKKVDGKTHVVIKVYYDLVGPDDFDNPPNNWGGGDEPGKPYFTFIDEGDNMGALGKRQCNVTSIREIFTWGGPIVTFRIDSTKRVDFKWLSVREIQPPRR